MDLYNNFFYLAQFTLDETKKKISSYSMYAFHLYLIADTGEEFERFNIPSIALLKEDKVALYMKFKLLLDGQTRAQEASVKLASLLYKDSFSDFIEGFENYTQYRENIICKGKIDRSCDLNDVMLEVIKDIKNNLSNPLNLNKYPENSYHNPHTNYKNRIARKLPYIPDLIDTEIKNLTQTNMDKSYTQNFDETTAGDLAFKKYPFYIASPHGPLKSIRLNDKLQISLPHDKQTKVHKI